MITTLSGTNSLLLSKELQRIRNDFIAHHSDLGVERFDAAEASFQQLLDAVQTLPFLASRRMVIIDTPSANKDLTEKIASLLQAVPDTADLVFVEPKFDKRGSLYKTLHKQSDFHEFSDLNEAQLVTWLVGYASEQGATLAPNAARKLVQHAGLDQLKLQHEVDKLAAYASQITNQSIELLVAPTGQSSTFDLLDAALAGKTKRALELYEDQRRQRVEPQAILALLGWQLHVLATVKAAADRSVDQISRDAKLNPYVVRKTAGLAARLTMTNIKELVAHATKLDARLKREALDADEALQNLIVSMRHT